MLISAVNPCVEARRAARVACTRTPRPDEVDAMLALFSDEVAAGRMLPRNADRARENLDDWLVAVEGGRIVGCVSLVAYNGTLSELRSLAVHPSARGRGLGRQLIRAALDLARARGVPRVLALTRAVKLFEQCGFRRTLVANFPEKVWRDCEPCPLKEMCDEVALVYNLSRANGRQP